MSVGTETEKYLRVVSLSIAGYDYLITIPAELRFYRSQSNILRPSLGCVLFVLIRYVSIIVMVVSNYGVLASSFTVESCSHYFLVAPFFKVLQTMVSQVILGVRTFNIARRERVVGIVLVTAFVITTALEWFTNMYNRTPVMDNGNCTPGNGGAHQTAWTYYVVAMVWDTGTMFISTFYLVRYNTINGRLSRLIQTMLYDGLGYFLVLTCGAVQLAVVPVLNALKSAGASLGYVVTWIMSQRVLIHLRELSEPSQVAQFENIILTRPPQPVRSIISVLRSPGEIRKTPLDMEYTPGSDPDMELDVQVHVEQSVMIDYEQSSRKRLTE